MLALTRTDAALGHGDQQRIARRMAMHIVYGLEAVEVEQQDRERRGIALGERHLAAKELVEQAPVGEPGERIVVRELLDPRGVAARPPVEVAEGHREADEDGDGPGHQGAHVRFPTCPESDLRIRLRIHQFARARLRLQCLDLARELRLARHVPVDEGGQDRDRDGRDGKACARDLPG